METENKIAVIILILLTVAAVSLIPYAIGYGAGYRTGQIDALNGKIHYRLEMQENSEFKWVECPAVCEYEKAGGE